MRTTIRPLAAIALLAATVGVAAAQTGSPTLSLRVTSGLPRTPVQVMGSGFGPNESIRISFDATAMGSISADPSGAFQKFVFRVPREASEGDHLVSATGQTTSLVASATFTVVLPRISLSATEGPPTSVVTVSGTNFRHLEDVTIYFDSAIRGAARLDESGAFTETIRVQRSASSGDHRVTATGETSNLSASAAFTVVFPSLSLSPTVGPPTITVAVTGASFPGEEEVALTLGSTALGSARADLSGGFLATVRIPRHAGSGRHRITASGKTSGLEAGASFRVRIDDWRQYGFDAAHSGNNPNEILLGPPSVGALTSAWTKTIGPEGALAVAFSSPAVVDGVVYIGSEAGKVYAIDAWTGRILWTRKPDDTCPSTTLCWMHNWSSPAVVKGVVYIGGDKLYARRASTGAILWTVDTGDDTWSPSVAKGVVYVTTVDKGMLFAVRAADGTILWKKSLGDPGPSGTGAAPTVSDGVVYVGSASQELFALDALSGNVLWTVPMGEEAGTPPTVVNGVAYAPSAGHLRAIDASTGLTLWTTEVEGGLSSPAVDHGVVFVGGSSGLYAFDAATGALEWSTATGYSAESSPAAANGVIYAVGGRQPPEVGSIYALDATTGEILWSAPIASEGGRPDPRVVNGMLYTGSESGELYAFSLP